MKKLNIVLLMSFVIAASLVVSGCEKKSEQYGAPSSIRATTNVKDIFINDKLLGQKVKLDGIIQEECMTGCWINLKDDTGVIFVDLKNADIAIPQRLKRRVIVHGKVVEYGGKPMVNGEGILIK